MKKVFEIETSGNILEGSLFNILSTTGMCGLRVKELPSDWTAEETLPKDWRKLTLLRGFFVTDKEKKERKLTLHDEEEVRILTKYIRRWVKESKKNYWDVLGLVEYIRRWAVYGAKDGRTELCMSKFKRESIEKKEEEKRKEEKKRLVMNMDEEFIDHTVEGIDHDWEEVIKEWEKVSNFWTDKKGDSDFGIGYWIIKPKDPGAIVDVGWFLTKGDS